MGVGFALDLEAGRGNSSSESEVSSITSDTGTVMDFVRENVPMDDVATLRVRSLARSAMPISVEATEKSPMLVDATGFRLVSSKEAIGIILELASRSVLDFFTIGRGLGLGRALGAGS